MGNTRTIGMAGMATHLGLKIGDNDSRVGSGKKSSPKSPIYNVTRLQTDLKSVGVFPYKADGVFGPNTQKSLKIFQWACANIPASIKNKARISRLKTPSVFVNGKLDKVTMDELALWVTNKQVTTGDLIRVAFSSLSAVEAGSGFKKIGTSNTMKGDLIISKAALSLIKKINKEAIEKKITIKINQAFRVSGVKVTGAVVTPASKSQHLIGHAIDCNIVDGANWNNSTNFKNKTETENAKKIIKSLKASGYRWGGDFKPVDTPHFDKQLLSSHFAYDAKFYLNQRMLAMRHNIPKVTI